MQEIEKNNSPECESRGSAGNVEECHVEILGKELEVMSILLVEEEKVGPEGEVNIDGSLG